MEANLTSLIRAWITSHLRGLSDLVSKWVSFTPNLGSNLPHFMLHPAPLYAPICTSVRYRSVHRGLRRNLLGLGSNPDEPKFFFRKDTLPILFCTLTIAEMSTGVDFCLTEKRL